MVENETLSHAAEVEAEPAEAAAMPEETSDAAVGTESEVQEPSAPAAQAGPGQASLTLKRAGAETTDVFVFGTPAVIGRFDPAVGPVEVDLGVLDEGRYVSRKHAKITCEDGVWTLFDLGSSNGTYLLRSDFERVDEAELSDGSEVAFGNARFVFHVGGAEASADEPA